MLASYGSKDTARRTKTPNTMYLKDSVRFKNPEQAILVALMVARLIYEKHGYNFVITSWNDGVHSQKSLHYDNAAFDCRTHHLPAGLAPIIRDEIDNALPDGFDVLLEGSGTDNEHIHVEADLRPKVH